MRFQEVKIFGENWGWF